jgi:hypothetical protein
VQLRAVNSLKNNPTPKFASATSLSDVVFQLQRTSEQISDSESRDIYTAAVVLLSQNLILAAEKTGVKMTALPFPILVSDMFMEILKGEDQLTLVIFANYAVLLHWLRGYVWLRGWGKQIVEAVKHPVGTGYWGCLE